MHLLRQADFVSSARLLMPLSIEPVHEKDQEIPKKAIRIKRIKKLQIPPNRGVEGKTKAAAKSRARAKNKIRQR